MTAIETARLGVALALIFPPALAVVLLLAPGRTRWISRALAVVLVALWAPLMLHASDIFSALTVGG